ncbi:MAG TPA: extracellular solute-binding protein [Aggregatilineales bacterium]|nr:extracellular solute-binding protein [Aggregatilineales bacterium]
MKSPRLILLIGLCLPLIGVSIRPARAATTLVFWHSWRGADADLLATWITDFTAKNQDILIAAQFVPFDQLLSRLESAPADSRPDFVIGPSDWASELVAKGLLNPIEGKVDASFKFSPPARFGATVSGDLYAVPETLEGIALYYNKALIGDAKPPTTLDDLLASARTLGKGDTVGLLMDGSFYATAGIFFAQGGTIFSGTQLAVTDANALKAYLTTASKLVQGGKDSGIQITPSTSAFIAGKAAYLIEGSWRLREMEMALGDKLGVALLPGVNGAAWSPFVRSTQFYFVAKTLRLTYALNFAQYAAGADQGAIVAQKTGRIPANPDARPGDPSIATFMKQFAAGTIIPTRREMGRLWEPLDRAVAEVIAGGEPIDQTVSRTRDALLTAIGTPATSTPAPG